jgi:hypothetical protein
MNKIIMSQAKQILEEVSRRFRSNPRMDEQSYPEHIVIRAMELYTGDFKKDLQFMLTLSETWGKEWFNQETWERISDIRSRMFYSSLTEDEKKQISKSEKTGT